MIRVNLLKIRKKRFSPIYLEILLFVMIIGGLVFSFNLIVQGLNSKIQLIETEINKLNIEYKKLQKVKREVDAFKSQKKELQSKINIIINLKQDQKGYYKLMTELEKSMPDDVWINTFNYNGSSVDISGSSLRTVSINEFIINLYRSNVFSNINLKVVRKKTVENIDINDFSIVADVRLSGV